MSDSGAVTLFVVMLHPAVNPRYHQQLVYDLRSQQTESSRRYPPEETIGLCGLYGASVAHSLLCQDKSLT